MERQELTKTFMMTSNCKKKWPPCLIQKSFSVVRVNILALLSPACNEQLGYRCMVHTVEPAMSSHSYEQPTSYEMPVGHSPK